MDMIETKQKPVSKSKTICEFQAKHPNGSLHCVHDDHINWKMHDGCTPELCPLTKVTLKGIIK